MLVGIDASRAITSAPTGTEIYSRELITALLQLGSPIRYLLYTRSAPPVGLFPQTGNYDLRVVPFPLLWTQIRLAAEMLRTPPDVLFVPAHVLPLLHPPSSLVTVHDLGYLHFPLAHRRMDRQYLDLSTRWNVRAAARVIVDSCATRDDLILAYGVNRDKIHVVYPALRAGAFRPVGEPAELDRVKERYRLGNDYLIAVGTLHPRKNYVRLLEAFQALPALYQLVIVGKRGWLFQEILATIERLDLGARVRLVDYVLAADLPALYSGARLCVFPSLYEGFGFPVLEAQACGVPVVCSNVSSLPEVAGAGAQLFDPLDTMAMVAALSSVLNDSARRRELVQQGLLNLERFSWQRSAERVLSSIRELANGA
jgi:glycosyltransferase involved in cell wall biosynthesis